jgi:hypothetical protein
MAKCKKRRKSYILRCSLCGVRIEEFERFKTSQGDMCEDCWELSGEWARSKLFKEKFSLVAK